MASSVSKTSDQVHLKDVGSSMHLTNTYQIISKDSFVEQQTLLYWLLTGKVLQFHDAMQAQHTDSTVLHFQISIKDQRKVFCSKFTRRV